MSNKEIKITFFGDSICVGSGVSVHEGWVSLVSEKLQSVYSNLVVANSSVNGRTTRQALENMPYEIQSNPPDILLIQFGMNDCNYWRTDRGLSRVSYNSFKSNLDEIINRALYCGVKKVCLNTNHPTARTETNLSFCDFTYQDSNKKYNAAIREIAAERSSDFRIHFFDVEEYFNDVVVEINQYVLSSPDLLHLNSEGHKLYCSFIYPKLESLIAEIKK